MFVWCRPYPYALLTSIIKTKRALFLKAIFLVLSQCISTSTASQAWLFSAEAQRLQQNLVPVWIHEFKYKSFFNRLSRESIQSLELFSLNLVGVSLLLATIDTGNISTAVSMKLKMQLVWSRNFNRCLHCPHTQCVMLVEHLINCLPAWQQVRRKE